MNGDVLATFTDINWYPCHLSSDNKAQLLVADYINDRILLLNNQLQLLRVLVPTRSQVKLWRPMRLHVNDVTSQLYVVYDSCDWFSRAPFNEKKPLRGAISVFSLQ